MEIGGMKNFLWNARNILIPLRILFKYGKYMQMK